MNRFTKAALAAASLMMATQAQAAQIFTFTLFPESSATFGYDGATLNIAYTALAGVDTTFKVRIFGITGYGDRTNVFNSLTVNLFASPTPVERRVMTSYAYVGQFQSGGVEFSTTGDYPISLSVTNLNQFTTFVPEPTTWALMLAGFAMTGYAMRRRRPQVVYA